MLETLISHLTFTEDYETFNNLQDWCNESGFDYKEACFCVWSERKYLNEKKLEKFKKDFQDKFGITIEEAYEQRKKVK